MKNFENLYKISVIVWFIATISWCIFAILTMIPLMWISVSIMCISYIFMKKFKKLSKNNITE